MCVSLVVAREGDREARGRRSASPSPSPTDEKSKSLDSLLYYEPVFCYQVQNRHVTVSHTEGSNVVISVHSSRSPTPNSGMSSPPLTEEVPHPQLSQSDNGEGMLNGFVCI